MRAVEQITMASASPESEASKSTQEDAERPPQPADTSGPEAMSESKMELPDQSKESNNSATKQRPQHGPADASTSTTPNTDAELMPPPTAPASLLFAIRPTHSVGNRHRDPFISSRLIAVTVTLFRQGKAKEAKALGQFTVDSVEEEVWIKYLHMYMGAETESVDVTFAQELVEEAREEMEKVDPLRAGFLAVLGELIQSYKA